MGSTSFTRGTELIAFFRRRSDALKAISELRDAGFTADQIGLAIGDDRMSGLPSGSADVRSGAPVPEIDDRSTWEKIKNFFRAEPETYTGDAESSSEVFGHLSVTGDRARYYESGIAGGGALVTVNAPADQMQRARKILEANNGDLRTTGFESRMNEVAGTGLNRPAANMGQPGERRIQLRGELLRTVKERINKGEIRLRKEVISEHQTVNVPVTREEVIVEQVPASSTRPVSGNIGDQGEVRIPVSEERVHVTKEPVVTGEVRAQKRAVQDTQQVSGDVRHEEVRVENEGDVEVTDKTKGKKKPAA
jgi:uncharacterized protein (TIGR02271 family)